MRRSELDLVVQWAADEGWNPGKSDADAFYAADREGFFVGVIGELVVASLSVVTYDQSYAFVGCYLVRPEYRGSGYGFRLWRYALRQASAVTIGLDAVVGQVSNYERVGFRVAHRSSRYLTPSIETAPRPQMVRPLAPEDRGPVDDYDTGVFGAPRPRFLTPWLARADTTVRVAERDGLIVGYGAVRPAVDGYRIGPLFADSPEIANELLTELLRSAPSGSMVAIDVPAASAGQLDLIRTQRMAPEFETVRMYLGPPPHASTHRVYGLTSFELG